MILSDKFVMRVEEDSDAVGKRRSDQRNGFHSVQQEN